MHPKLLRNRCKLDLGTRHHSTGDCQHVRLTKRVLREPRVEPDHVPHAPKTLRCDLEPLCRDEPGDAFAAGRGSEGASVARGGKG